MNRLIALCLFTVVSALVVGDEPKKPAPKLPLSRQTTYVTGPLDADGYVDYEAALNERLGKGITPEKNANVLIWKVLGPKPVGGRMPPEFFKRLGIDEPPELGDYFVGLRRFLMDHLKLNAVDWDGTLDQQRRAMQRPWSSKDFPQIDAWLKHNEKPLTLAHDASRRPDYFNPLVSGSKARGSLLEVLLPAPQQFRELCTALTCRAMLRT